MGERTAYFLWVSSCQGAKKIIFTACHSGKLKLAFTSPDVISTSPKSFLTSRIGFTVLLLFEFLKKITCPSGKMKTEFTSPIAKYTSPGLSDTTFFARCSCNPLMSQRFSMVSFITPLMKSQVLKTQMKLIKPYPLDKSLYYIDTDEIPGFFLLLENHIFIGRSEDTIFIFHMWGYWCCHGY